jgi:hypothetical protein
MIATIRSTVELLRTEAVGELLRSPGPCVTMLLPPVRPGDGTSAGTLIKSNIQAAMQQLAELGLSRTASTNLLEPLENLSLAGGSHWSRAILCSPAVLQQFFSTQPLKPALSVGGCFAIKALLAELDRPSVFYILAVSRSGVALLRCVGLRAEPAMLPAGVPATAAELRTLEPSERTLENRSSIGSSAGTMHSMRFGTGTGREQEHAHLADFYKLVDRGIQPLLAPREIPLLLAGVQEDTALYRANSTYAQLIRETISGSFNVERDREEILRQAYAILRESSVRRHAAALKTARERTTPARFSHDVDAIVKAAFEGRVSELYLNESAEKIDLIERGAYRSWGKEDLLNLAAVQSIVHHGKAVALPAEMMPGRAMAAAIMRF